MIIFALNFVDCSMFPSNYHLMSSTGMKKVLTPEGELKEMVNDER